MTSRPIKLRNVCTSIVKYVLTDDSSLKLEKRQQHSWRFFSRKWQKSPLLLAAPHGPHRAILTSWRRPSPTSAAKHKYAFHLDVPAGAMATADIDIKAIKHEFAFSDSEEDRGRSNHYFNQPIWMNWWWWKPPSKLRPDGSFHFVAFEVFHISPIYHCIVRAPDV